MVQVLPPLNPIAHLPRPSNFRCSPVTRRRTLPTVRELVFSRAKHQNALERAAVRKFTALVAAQYSSLPKPEHPTTTVPAASVSTFASPSISVQTVLQSVPQTPLELEENFQPETKPKLDIFKNTTKSDELLDLTLAALHRIYIEDFSQDSGLFQSQPQAMMQPGYEAHPGAYKHGYDQSPPMCCGSSVSSANSTPCSLSTPPSLSPEFEPEIACPGDMTAKLTVYRTASHGVAPTKAQPVTRTQSLPNNFQYRASSSRAPSSHPVLEDKASLRWFMTELLRRSRASASVVQLALHYLTQARVPVGRILAQKFKSESVSEARTGAEDDNSDETDKGKEEMDSPLLDPRKLLLAALMLSTKILHDHAPNNRAWARVCGLEARDVTACERALGQALNWELAHMFVGPLNETVLCE